MSRKQWKRMDAVERVQRGKLTMAQGAKVLGLSPRQMSRLCRAFETGGANALVHGNRGRAPVHKVPEDVRARVTELMQTTYAGFNDHHFTEKLCEVEEIEISRATVQRILRSAGIAAVQTRRARKYRGRRKRKAQVGIMLLWDGSPHDWLEGRGPRLCLMGAVDDATGEIMPGAHFVEEECAASYLRVLLAILRAHGLPWSIYMDRHSALKRNDDHWTLEEEMRGKQDPTQVGRVLVGLDIEAIYALSPEAKGRVERLWRTLQDRLVSEMRLAGAQTKNEANAVLDAFAPDHNRRFGKAPEDSQPAWRAVPRGLDLERACSFAFTPKVARNNTVTFEGQTFDIPPGPQGRSRAGRRADLRVLLDGQIRIYIDDEIVATGTQAPPSKLSSNRKKTARPKVKRPRHSTKKVLTFKEIVAKVRAKDDAARTQHRGGKRVKAPTPPRGKAAA